MTTEVTPSTPAEKLLVELTHKLAEHDAKREQIVAERLAAMAAVLPTTGKRLAELTGYSPSRGDQLLRQAKAYKAGQAH